MEDSVEVKGRTDGERSDPAPDVATADARGQGSDESRCGGKHGSVQEPSMMEQVLSPENLQRAWRKVRANAGAPGIDARSLSGLLPGTLAEDKLRA